MYLRMIRDVCERVRVNIKGRSFVGMVGKVVLEFVRIRRMKNCCCGGEGWRVWVEIFNVVEFKNEFSIL